MAVGWERLLRERAGEGLALRQNTQCHVLVFDAVRSLGQLLYLLLRVLSL